MQKEFIDILLKHHSGELKLNPEKAILPYGTSWNVADTTSNKIETKSSREWFAEIEGVDMATTLEFPYANIDGQMVTHQNARPLGKDIADAISRYLQRKYSNN